MSIAWFEPVCTDALRKIYYWYVNYEQGDPSADRPFLQMDGHVVDKVTKYANEVFLTSNELAHIIRILDKVASKDPLSSDRKLVEFYINVFKGLKYGEIRPGGQYRVVLDAYKQDVHDTLVMLWKAKTGQTESLADIIAEQVKQGKSPFEV